MKDGRQKKKKHDANINLLDKVLVQDGIKKREAVKKMVLAPK